MPHQRVCQEICVPASEVHSDLHAFWPDHPAVSGLSNATRFTTIPASRAVALSGTCSLERSSIRYQCPLAEDVICGREMESRYVRKIHASYKHLLTQLNHILVVRPIEHKIYRSFKARLQQGSRGAISNIVLAHAELRARCYPLKLINETTLTLPDVPRVPAPL